MYKTTVAQLRLCYLIAPVFVNLSCRPWPNPHIFESKCYSLTMKAYLIRSRGDLSQVQVAETDAPATAAGHILIKVKAAALNPADLKVISGKDGGRFIHSSKVPIHLGFDYSGVVEQVAGDASSYAIGEEVFGFLPYSTKTRQGSFAEYISVREDEVAPKPSAISHAEAASAATVGLTALQSLSHIAGADRGQRILVNGASGGVGQYGVQIGKCLGAEVWGTCSAPKMEFVRALGADRVLDYAADPWSTLDERFDVILDTISNLRHAQYAKRLKRGGSYVATLPSAAWLGGKLRSLLTTKRVALVVVKPKRKDLSQLAAWLADGSVKAHVWKTFPFAELPAALEAFASGGALGKIVVEGI